MVTVYLKTIFVLFLCILTHGAPKSIVIDLGYGMNEKTQFWPGLQKFTVTSEARKINENEVPWFAYNTFKTAEHVGTHTDAPFHMIENGWKIGDIPLNRFFVDGVLIDVSCEVGDNCNFELLPEHITNWEKDQGIIPEESVVLVRFGWSHLYYNNRDKYFGLKNDDASKLCFPGLSDKAARLLVSRKIYGVGVDTASLDPGKNVTFHAHRTLFNASIYGLEHLNLTNSELPATSFKLHIMPMKITEGTGAPSRVIAFVKPDKLRGEPIGNCQQDQLHSRSK